MPSPFPGMDPYLEAHWRDVHVGLVVYASDALQGILPAALRARIDERILLQHPDSLGDQLRRAPARLEKSRALAEPLLVEAELEPVSETYVKIIDCKSGNRVVTVIEFLSPSNKSPGRNREQYLRKQREICSSDANLVEIDLNRFGIHTLAFALVNVSPTVRTPYMACVRRTTRRGLAEVYPLPLRQRLPIVKVPLRPDDADVPLDLQALVEQCYRNGGYEGTLNYAAAPDPPLSGADEEWADAWLHEKGLRPRKKPPRRKGKPKPR
ncbi:MAG TPA: DUF4058 family protein [Gemmataceae bacterium]|nr:DUF4058 family protein [Gemmataceae bacterium]